MAVDGRAVVGVSIAEDPVDSSLCSSSPFSSTFLFDISSSFSFIFSSSSFFVASVDVVVSLYRNPPATNTAATTCRALGTLTLVMSLWKCAAFNGP